MKRKGKEEKQSNEKNGAGETCVYRQEENQKEEEYPERDKKTAGTEAEKMSEMLKKSAYSRRLRRNLFLLLGLSFFLTAISVAIIAAVFVSDYDPRAAFLLFGVLVLLGADSYMTAQYFSFRKKSARARKVEPLSLCRKETAFSRGIFCEKRYAFEISYREGGVWKTGMTRCMYSEKCAGRAEELFRKGVLTVVLVPESEPENLILPDL